MMMKMRVVAAGVLLGAVLAALAAWRTLAPSSRAAPAAEAAEAPATNCARLAVVVPRAPAAAERLAQRLAEDACRRAEERLGLRLPAGVVVEAAEDQAALRAACGPGAVGCFDSEKKRVVVGKLDTDVIAHETGHALLRLGCRASLPAWVEEALSEEAAGESADGDWASLAGVMTALPPERRGWLLSFSRFLWGRPLEDWPRYVPTYGAAHNLLIRLLLPDHSMRDFAQALCATSAPAPDAAVAAAFKRLTGRDLEAALREVAGVE